MIVVGEDVSNGPAGQKEAALWRDSYAQTGVVVADPRWDSGPTWYPFGVAQGESWSIGLPGTLLMGAGLEVISMGRPTDAQVVAALPQE